ncbi:RCC1 domain-containing protein [Bifidobacterium kimbladii]|uniref:RCC1 repeat domain protein, 2 domains n=1 Tax=Bifidobacterium asteroides TaxID=1684 RepID=A0A0F4KWP0_9BIFI|nr:InlB B-repeat-containing protein [Bifidobacterium asteroides]KJY49641.1 RCC1 repeat domain protein, 2 domains [Bifidobacterium asteroides]
MHLVSQLRRIMAMMIVLLGMLAGLGVASAQSDAPILTGGLQTPSVAEQPPATLPGNATNTPLPTPSPLTPSSPLSTTTPSPNTPSSPTGTPDTTGSASTKPSDSDDQTPHMVRFDPADGSKPTQASVKTGALAAPPQQNPQRRGFRFDGWTLDGQPFDFRTPVLQDTTLKAQWSKATDWTLSPDHGPASGTVLTISPPDRQEPQFAGIQAAGGQILGLTGDGRIYTWTQDGTPNKVPAPVQAPDGFRYLQAAAGSQRQAALGSDQHIYTWTSQQPTPAILDTGQDARFTGISITDNRLLAVDRQGQIRAYQSRDADSQDPNPKLTQQATTSLPGKAQAVTAVSSSRRILIVDTDGQAWTWDTSSPGNAKPARVKQKPGMRIIQAQALNQGFLLLDTDGQAWYLADGKNTPTAAGLPDGTPISRITSSGDQATIIDKNDHVWAWKPGEAPTRKDNGNQQYMQATAAGSRITAINRQGSIFTWNPDTQSNQGKPSRVDTTQAPTLETASMNGQALTLTKNNDSWQADMPVHKPGQAAILIAGRQDGQSFTKSLTYTVDQLLTRDDQQGTTHAVTFNAAGGSPEPTDQTVSTPNDRVERPSPDPTREGYQFDGWFIGQVAYDFSKPVTQNLTLTAKWTFKNPNNTWKISPDKGSQLGNESTTITPPDTSRGIRFNQVSGSKHSIYSFSLAVGSDGNAYAWGYNNYGQLGDGTTTQRTTPVKVSKPEGTPADFTYVQVSAGGYHSLALGSDGYVYTWGWNKYGQLGKNINYNTDKPNPVPQKILLDPKDASTGVKAIQVSGAAYHSMALGSDGNIYAWGSNNFRLGDGTKTNRSTPVKVSKPADAPADFTYVQVSAGWGHGLALDSDGNAYAWGWNPYGQLGDGTQSDRSTPVKVSKPVGAPADFTYVQVSAGFEFSLVVGSDGYAYAWGHNEYGQLGNNTVSAYGDANPVPVRVRDPASPTDESKGLKVLQVRTGWDVSLALGSDGNAYAWGYGGALGDGKTIDGEANPVPVRVRDPASPTDESKGLKAVQVRTGWGHSLAVGRDGNTYAWGSNRYGELGNNSIPTGTSKSEAINAISRVPVPVMINLQPVITGVRFDQAPVSGLKRADGNSVTVLTPAHVPGPVTVSVDYKLGDNVQKPDTSLTYTYTPAGVLPQAGGEGIMLALAAGITGMGGVLASRRHRRETQRLLHTSLK